MELQELTIAQAHQGLLKKEFSSLELTKAYLNCIAKREGEIHAFITVTEELAYAQAKAVDVLIGKGQKISPLAGIPAALKDNLLVEGVKATCGSKILENYVAPYDATCVRKLKKQGSVIVGKTNLDEFAMGSSTENSGFFPTKNPRDTTRVPGGSSGGSAAAVAANFCAFALGSDTGGSIRQPASFCGVVGLKPTYGAVSRYGLVAFASSLDQIGPLAKTVQDAEIVFNAIGGTDPLDATSVDRTQIKKEELAIKNMQIGVPKEYFISGMDEGVQQVMKGAIRRFEKLGAKIEEISLPHTEYALPVYYVVAMSEASANLARYDGIKYGVSTVKEQGNEDLLSVYLSSRGRGFGAEVKRRIMLGTYALSAGYYDAYYLKAQKVRTLLKQDFEEAFSRVDVILTPVSPTPAFRFGEKMENPLQMYLADIFTISVNLAGLPAISIPAGASENLPVGIQLIGKPFQEHIILELGKQFELNG